MKKIRISLVLLACVIGISLCFAKSPVEWTKKNDTYIFKFTDGPYGDDNTAWKPTFYFSDYGVTVDFMVLSKTLPPSGEKGAEKVKIDFTNNTTLTLILGTNDLMHFSGMMHESVMTPKAYDSWNTPITYITSVNMKALSTYTIKSIHLNGMLLPGPYPKPSAFKLMFDEGASKCNGVSYFKDYLTMKSMPGGSSKTKSYSGVTVPFLKLAEAPFGYRPTSANYKFDVLIQSAKKTYGWDISKLDVGGYGFVWPQLNGMKFLNFPVYRLVANAYALYDNTDIGNMLCEIVCSKQEVSKARASLKKLLLSNGWTLHKSGTYYKGKVYIDVQEEENKKFPGKVILNITSVIYPGPYPLKEFLGNGQG